MHPHTLTHNEPEMEALLQRLVPNLAQEWKGATPEEIDELEAIAGRPLPGFYRWFLSRMGKNMGPIEYPTIDFSAETILSCYADGLVKPDPRFLMIGYERDEVMPLHLFYDFNYPARDDARVTKRFSEGGSLNNISDTFREMLAWGRMSQYRIVDLPQRCEGSFDREEEKSLSLLEPIMERLGFTRPIATGNNCAIYERSDAAMTLRATPSDPPDLFYFFDLGGAKAKDLQRILETIVDETSWELEIDEWEPPLPE